MFQETLWLAQLGYVHWLTGRRARGMFEAITQDDFFSSCMLFKNGSLAFVCFVSAVWRKQFWNEVLPPAASQYSDCHLSKRQVQLCPPTCLTCRDQCQTGPEFTQMLIRTDPESTGITSHMWWNGGNNFRLLHCTHPKGWLLCICWVIYNRKLPWLYSYKPQDWTQFLFSSTVKKQGIGFGQLTVLMGLPF